MTAGLPPLTVRRPANRGAHHARCARFGALSARVSHMVYTMSIMSLGVNPDDDLDNDPDGEGDVAGGDTTAGGGRVALREARGMLGELASLAFYRDQVTYLTRYGRALAAVVPACAARTAAQARGQAAQQERLHTETERRVQAVVAELHRQVNRHERRWADALLGLCAAVEELADANPPRAAAALRAVDRLREHAAGVVTGQREWADTTAHSRPAQAGRE